MRCYNFLKGFSLVLACFASFALAQPSNQNKNYTFTVDYDGASLYSKSGNQCKAVNKSAEGTYSLNVTGNGFTTVTLYSDDRCKTTLYSKQVSQIVSGNSTTGTITISAAPAPKSSASTVQDPTNPAASSSSVTQQTGGNGGKPNGGNQQPSGKTVIRFLTPWSNTSAVLFVNGDSTAAMTKVKNYCGWFETRLNPPSSGLKVFFKQTIGLNFVGAEGMVQKEPTSTSFIDLDSIAALTDTIWVQGYKNDVPALFAKYPGVLGECPLKKFPVTVFDWLHGDKGDGANGNGASSNGVSADFGSGGCDGSNAKDDKGNGYMKGMVENKLGANGVPVPATNFPTNCKLTDHLDKWFLPETVVKKNGVEYTNMTCRDIYISMDDAGFWLAEVSGDNVSEGNDRSKGGMYLVDDFEYLDEAKTIKNPYFDQLKDKQNRVHNYGFAVKIQATFEYVPGQYFDFYGDDDVWVFIDNRLAVDIGGQHGQVAGAVDLDTMGLKVGNTYNFHIFYVERHRYSSNFRMRTSIDLQVDASIFVTSDKKGSSTNYDIWQINKKNKLSCGYDPSNTEVDTTGGASTFRLTGGNLEEPEILGIGTHYEGLKITSDSTFSIDSAAIVDNAALAPGHYYLEITLKSDPSQSTIIEITIPSYPLPSVAFADEKWKVLGKEISGNQATIGSWAYEIYPVNITFYEDNATVNDYNKKISLSSSNALVEIIDADGNAINKVTLNDKAQATFYIRATAEAKNVTITAKGTAAAASFWKELNFKGPPIPRVEIATIFDRNGDGRGDSLYVKYDKSFDDSNILDSIQFTFGETFNVISGKNIKKASGSEIIVVTEGACDTSSACGFGSRQFTGDDGSTPYTGNISTWVTYKENGNTHKMKTANDPVNDGIGPIVVKATKETMSDGNRKVTVTFSEAITDESRKNFYKEMFEYICYRSGENKQPEEPVQQGGSGKTIAMIFSPSTLDAVFPTDGDQIRFVPGKGNESAAVDLNGNKPHVNNPWVIIVGDQELTNQSPGLIAVGEDPYGIIVNNTTTQPLLVTDNKQDAQQIGDSLGVQGNLVDFDISKIMAEQTMKDIAALDAYITKITGESSDTTYEYTEISETEATKQLFSDINDNKIGAGISVEVIEAIQKGEITANNYSSKIKGNDLEVVKELIQAKIEISRDSTPIPPTITSYDDIFQQIADGVITEKDLKKAGVSETVIQAIKDGMLTSTNVESYRSGEESLISEDAVVLQYQTRYYDHLGSYVGGKSGTIKCTDEIYGAGGCLNNKGKLFLAWNMRDQNGRLAATGVYIARLEVKVKVNGKVTIEQTRDKLWGVRRGKTNNLKLEF